MTQSFTDWQNQLAAASIAGGVLGGDQTNPDSRISMDTALGSSYDSTRNQLIDKMGGDDYLKTFYDQGLSPQQILYGNTGQAKPTAPTVTGSEDSGFNTVSAQNPQVQNIMYNGDLWNDPNAVKYDPNQGVVNTSGNKEGMWDKFQGEMLPGLIG